MGVHKKERNRGKNILGSTEKKITKMKGENFYRDQKKLKYINMLKGGKAVRDKHGNVVKAADFQNSIADGTVARIEPNRKWFGNTRVIGQKQLEEFREEMSKKVNDPYSVLLHQNKLPMSLLVDAQKQSRMHMLETQSFSQTFGSKSQRKRPKLSVSDVKELVEKVDESSEQYEPAKDSALLANKEIEFADMTRDVVFSKGQSKRIWNELYKVVDSSDVVIHVLDARDPMGTRCRNVEDHIKKEAKHKHLIFMLNKCDLVPTWVTARWVKILSREYPTLAFHASITNPFGKGSLIQLLRQFAKLHSDKKQISVGFIGYPNTGKSSIINTLKKKKVCNVAPIPGETKVWQYITLMRRIYLIDCPGIVYPSEDTEADIVLKGVVRVENLKNPEDYIPELVNRVKRVYLVKSYEVDGWETPLEFLEMVAKKSGKLLKGGEPDVGTVAKMVLNDWLRGRIPYFTPPPEFNSDESKSEQPNAEAATQDVKTPSVTQIFSKIPVVANFLKEDLKRDDELPSEEVAVEEKTVLNEEQNQEVEEAETVDWDEIFENVVGEEGEKASTEADTSMTTSVTDVTEVLIDESSDDDDEAESLDNDKDESEKSGSEVPHRSSRKRKLKAPKFTVTDNTEASSERKKRKLTTTEANDETRETKVRRTTNKQKVGVHYYETANVKNKNREKKNNKPVDTNKLEKRMKGDGKRKGNAGGKRKR
ncbi:NUC091 domain-containing protein [Paraphysoderma sedebokerense]|nr:NUC091 domain-containing protein [Paraphysoderma sedebokerense]